MMNIEKRLSDIVSDLALERSFIKGQSVTVRNCWHFYTSGDSVEALFRNEEDFRSGMNRIFVVGYRFDILIVAFVLMDTHVHFILYGDFDACSRFMHEYVRITSMYMSSRYMEYKSLKNIEIAYQVIDCDRYLKTAICYVMKNPVEAGLPYNAWDYPWSSCSLYFRPNGDWTSPGWKQSESGIQFTKKEIKQILKTHCELDNNIRMIGELIFPGEYTAVDIAERIFRTHRAFNYFMSISKDVDVESREGVVSCLTVPINELRNYRRQLSLKYFGKTELRSLDVSQRLRLAKIMKAKYNSSSKQIARVCGLVYDEVRDYLG